MSDKGSAIFVTISQYMLSTFSQQSFGSFWLMLVGSIPKILLCYSNLIINCTALLMGGMQKILDRLTEIEKEEKL